jgi:hypothetical protein
MVSMEERLAALITKSYMLLLSIGFLHTEGNNVLRRYPHRVCVCVCVFVCVCVCVCVIL